jgi:hypothetical protein
MAEKFFGVEDIKVIGLTSTKDLIVSGISTLGVTTLTNVTAQQLNVSGITTLGVTTLTHVTAQQLNVSGVSTLGVTTLTNVTAQQLNVSGVSTLGVTTLTNVTAQQLNVSGVSTLGVTTLTNVTSQQLIVSGISTIGNIFIEPVGTGASVGEKNPGVSGVVTFYGDGSGLRNVVAIGTGIDVQNSGVAAGSASTINFGNNLTGDLTDGVYTVNSPDIPDLYWTQNSTGIHTLGNVGIGTTTADNQLVVKGNVDIDDVFITDYRGEWYIPAGYARQTTAQNGTGITSPGVGAGATRTTDAQIYDHCWDYYEAFDLDGDGIVSSSDTRMFLNYAYGGAYGDSALIGDLSNVYPYNATRTTHEEIRRHLSKYDYIPDTGVSYTNTQTLLSGITTSSSTKILDVGIGVTGPGISAGTTVTAIGVDSVTVSQAVTQTQTSATVYFGNGVLDVDGNKSVEALIDSLMVIKVFGKTISDSPSPEGTPPRTKEDFENYDFSNASNLSPDDGGGAQFRGIRGVGIGTTVLATDNNYSLQVVGKSKLDGDLNISGVSTFDGSLTLKGNRDFLIKSVFDLPDGSILENEHFTVKDGDVFIREDLTVDGNIGIVVNDGDVIVGGGISVGVGISIGPDIVETRKSTDIKLNETLYITPDDNVQNWYIPVGYARTTSPQVGTALTQSALASWITYTRGTDALVYDYCWDNYEIFDLDGDGIVSPIDAHIFHRYYLGSAFHSAILTNNYDSLFSSNATRTDYTSIIGYIIKYAKQTQTVSFSSGITTISGITTGTNVPEVRPGIAVTGTGIPANTTVIEIGTGTMTLNYATTSTETGVTLTFGNGLHNIRGGPSIQSLGDGLILSRIFGSATVPGSPYTAVHYESYQYNNNEFLNPNDGGPAQFKRYQKVSIADTTSNAGGARYISTEAPSAGIGTEGDIWYDISATGDSAGTNGNIPIGGIIMWYGSVANIPISWRLCDGQSHSTAIGTIQTPDLRGQFVVGAGTDTQNAWGFDATTGAQTFTNGQSHVGVGSTGGSVAHQLTEEELAAHTHSFQIESTSGGGGNNTVGGTVTTNTSSTGDDKYHENRPPYYALAYIMRIV